MWNNNRFSLQKTKSACFSNIFLFRFFCCCCCCSERHAWIYVTNRRKRWENLHEHIVVFLVKRIECMYNNNSKYWALSISNNSSKNNNNKKITHFLQQSRQKCQYGMCRCARRNCGFANIELFRRNCDSVWSVRRYVRKMRYRRWVNNLWFLRVIVILKYHNHNTMCLAAPHTHKCTLHTQKFDCVNYERV